MITKALEPKRHPLSALFSQFDLAGKDLDNLVADIKANGLLNPITSHDGMVLDGWNRYQACLKAKVRPLFSSLPPGLDPWKFVWAMNGQRRHMTAADLVSIHLKHEEMIRPRISEAGETERPKSDIPSVREISKELGVSRGTANLAQKVMKAHDLKLNEALANREVSLEQAAELAQLPHPERQAVLEAPTPTKPVKAPKSKKEKSETCPNCKPLREELDELISESRANNDEFQAMVRICDADDKLAQMRKELAQSAAMNRVLQERVNGKMNECNALIQDAKRWMKRAEKAEKKLAELDADTTFKKGA